MCHNAATSVQLQGRAKAKKIKKSSQFEEHGTIWIYVDLFGTNMSPCFPVKNVASTDAFSGDSTISGGRVGGVGNTGAGLWSKGRCDRFGPSRWIKNDQKVDVISFRRLFQVFSKMVVSAPNKQQKMDHRFWFLDPKR